MPATVTATTADPIGAAASLSVEARTERLKELFRLDAATRGEIAVLLGEVDRSESYREEGATSTEAWVVERFGVSATTARALTHVGGKAWDAPQLVGSMCAGDVSFDKVRAVIDVATPETERELRDHALGCTVRELAEVARVAGERSAPSATGSDHHAGRYLRYNDTHRTITTQLPAESYAAARACIDAFADQVPSEPETPLDQRRCDGFMGLMEAASPRTTKGAPTVSPFLVVAHVPLDALTDRQTARADWPGNSSAVA